MNKREAQLEQMLVMQDEMNSCVSDTWRENGYEWYRAIWTECAEMLDHHGWKWWKHHEIDIPQVQLELVDIFHFGLSLELSNGAPIDEIAEYLSESLEYKADKTDFKAALEDLASAAITPKSFDAYAFAECMGLMDMDLDELFKQYIGKNTLNFFRQANGYKDGSYIKVWNGEEDNEVLARLIKGMDSGDQHFKDKLYIMLESNYPV